MALHDLEGRLAFGASGRYLRGVSNRVLENVNPEAVGGDEGLMAVLLEEEPLQHQRLLVWLVGQVGRTSCEVAQNGVRLRQRAAVREY